MKTFQAALLLGGMIIGVGMFGIPFAFVQAGFWLGTVELAVLAGIMVALHLLYGEIVLATPTLHRLPGYVRAHLGEHAMPLVWFTTFFGIAGTLLIYLLVGSVFAHTVAQIFWSGSTRFFWVVALYGIQLIASAFSLRKEAAINGVATMTLVAFLFGMIIFLLPGVHFENLNGFHPSALFIPYGILFFALSGGTVIPDVITLVSRNKNIARRAIMWGSLIPAMVYFLFAAVIVGVSGNATAPDAITGLAPFVPGSLVLFGSVVGFLAILTSYLPLGESFSALLRLDCGMSRRVAWFAAATIPFALFLLGFQDFLRIMGTVGAVAVGIDIWLMVCMYHVIQRRRGLALGINSYAWKIALVSMASVGVVYELYEVFI